MKKSLLTTLVLVFALAMQAQYAMQVRLKTGARSTINVSQIDSICFIDMTEGATGDGTKENPYNVAAALKLGYQLDDTQVVENVYIKGFLWGKNATPTETGQLSYALYDKTEAKNFYNQITIYKGLYLGGEPFTTSDDLQYDAEIVVLGSIGKYRFEPEVIENSIIYSINGHTVSDLVKPKGTGTKNDPFNVAAAVAKCYELGDSPTDTTTYYTVGYVTEIREISTTYGNATFTISDTKKGSVNNLTIYRARGFNGESITDEKLFQIGDSVVVCGKLINYKGTTPELNQGYIASINGKGDNKPDTTEIGTLSNPMTVANALSMIEKLEDNTATASAYYIKGKVNTVKTSDDIITKYKNIDYTIVDEGKDTELTVFRGKYFDNTDFTVDNKVQVGDEVIVYGKLHKFTKNNVVKPEVTESYLIDLKKSSPVSVSVTISDRTQDSL